MPDDYANFQELYQHHIENAEYRIHAHARPGPLIVLAIHAGGIELGTSELARAIAGDEHSFYLFEGLTNDENKKLHLTSTHFDEPQCLDLVQRHHSALSLHGFNGSPDDPQIYMGGTDKQFIQLLLQTLKDNGYKVRINTQKFAATDRSNICNRTRSGQGVQIEIAHSLRRQFFQDFLTRHGREIITPQFTHFVQTIRSTLTIEK